jgi:hypothetical protein
MQALSGASSYFVLCLFIAFQVQQLAAWSLFAFLEQQLGKLHGITK